MFTYAIMPCAPQSRRLGQAGCGRARHGDTPDVRSMRSGDPCYPQREDRNVLRSGRVPVRSGGETRSVFSTVRGGAGR